MYSTSTVVIVVVKRIIGRNSAADDHDPPVQASILRHPPIGVPESTALVLLVPKMHGFAV